MAKIDLSGLKYTLKGAADAAKETTETVAGKVKGKAGSFAEKVKETKVPEIKMPVVKVPQVKEVFRKKEKAEETEIISLNAISTKNAMQVIYYMMASDGEIYHSEEEKFDAIGLELDPQFPEKKEAIVKECQTQLDKVIDPDDFYEVLREGVEKALVTSKQTEDTFITPKLLAWDLLTLAYSDESYSEAERKLLKYVVRKLDIDKAVFLEMESSILTLMDIERELSWIKTTSKPYLTIEAMVNELVDRRNVIFESIKDLISL